jgi:hypothetical protein
MRFRSSIVSSFVLAALTTLCLVPAARAQDRAGSEGSSSDGLIPGDYLRISGGMTTPVNAQGTLRDWGRGQSMHVVWETWGAGPSGVDIVSFGLGAGYSLLPFKSDVFVHDFKPTLVTGNTTSATASKAGVLEITTSFRVRIPAPYIMPHISVGLGFMNWHPATIHYTTDTGESADAKQQSRSGAEVSIGGGLDKQIYDRYGLFAEAIYAYGLTSFGQGLATPGNCATTACNALKNTSIGTIQAGLRVRIGR